MVREPFFWSKYFSRLAIFFLRGWWGICLFVFMSLACLVVVRGLFCQKSTVFSLGNFITNGQKVSCFHSEVIQTGLTIYPTLDFTYCIVSNVG